MPTDEGLGSAIPPTGNADLWTVLVVGWVWLAQPRRVGRAAGSRSLQARGHHPQNVPDVEARRVAEAGRQAAVVDSHRAL